MRILMVVMLVALAGCSAHQPYVKVGVGYKATEEGVGGQVRSDLAHAISCMAEVGYEGGSVSYGLRHHSQCFVGFPFNDRPEYSRNEVFVDYKYKFGR